MKIFIIILHFGDPKVTSDCIKSIISNRLSFEKIIVVDNGGNFEPSFENNLKVFKNRKNLGFAAGVNIGIKYALLKKADYILLLNNDTIVEEDFLSKLIAKSLKENIGILAPAIKFHKSGKVVYDLGGKLNVLFGRTTHNEVDKLDGNKLQVVDYVSGCCMLIKRQVLEKVGFFDERFFLYYEDVDFCLRAKKAGFKTYVLPSVSVYHKLSKSVGGVSNIAVYNQTKSALLFGKKYFGSFRLPNLLFIFSQSIYIFLKNPKVGKAAFLAIYRNL